ncbi:regulatory GntR family protein [Paraburkholderia silvatlantica]|uniref:Regulatory GntR family protein n=2 Tax=Paraburkholderia silvatlantica TaxID=321895 RepID=A0A2V4T3E7_9BURK|nr:regulatory GntR family protein [Paraburkholderia silvatlantica]TDQ86168.1 regulatory GntR family protein [Paraburkholderia silvatlantica]
MARGKTPVPLDLPLPASVESHGHGTMTKHEMAYRALCDAILERLLPEDARLPSSRMLAERWKLSRGTVESVFDRLRAEGYVTRQGGSGTRVCAVIPDSYLHASAVLEHAPQRTRVVALSAKRNANAKRPAKPQAIK